MNQLLRSTLSSVFYLGARCYPEKNPGTRILCYHRVNDEAKDYVTVPVSHFREQMRYLAAQGYRTAGLGDLLKGGPLEGNRVILTFDDGFRDNFENAYPILKELGFEATVFCIASRIGMKPYMNAEEMIEMKKAGFDIGSHTMTHAHLPELTAGQKREEIVESKKRLEEILGSAVDFFCYPYGEFDPESVRLVEEAGYRGACSNTPGANKAVNAFQLRRTEIAANDTVNDFKKKMAGAFDLMHQGLHWMRGRP